MPEIRGGLAARSSSIQSSPFHSLPTPRTRRIDAKRQTALAKLGQLLISRGWINLPQLTRALKNQSVVGGRLGTCLLEMDALTEEQLAKGLAEQLGLPGATIDQLRSVPEEVRGVLPGKVARRCHAVPFQLIGNRLDVVMLDPRNLTCHDEVAFASGRRVRVHVAPEIRIFEALERYYDEECPSRFTLLLDRLNRARYLWKEEKEGSAEEETPAPAHIPNRHRAPLGLDLFPDLPILGAERSPGPMLDLPVTPAKSAPRNQTGISPLVRPVGTPAPQPSPPKPVGARIIPLTAEERAELAREAAPPVDLEATAALAPPALAPNLPTTLDELADALEATTDRDALARLMLGFLARRFDRAALFQVARGQVSGWLAIGRDVDLATFSKYRVGLDQPSVFLNLDRGNSLHLGSLPPMPAHRELAKSWGGELPRRVAMLPIRLGDRLVAVLYADGGDAAWTGFGIDVLHRLSADFAAALERCIRQRRAQSA